MSEKVCEGEYGLIQKHEGSDERVEGLKLACPDGTVARFPSESKRDSVQKARRWLDEKGYNARVVDKHE